MIKTAKNLIKVQFKPSQVYAVTVGDRGNETEIGHTETHLFEVICPITIPEKIKPLIDWGFEFVSVNLADSYQQETYYQENLAGFDFDPNNWGEF